MVRPRGFEPLVGRPAGFIDAGFTDRWQEKDADRVCSQDQMLSNPWPVNILATGRPLDPTWPRSQI